MRILQVASEAVPLAKTGGLADVATGLSRALVAEGDDVRLLLPAYRDCARATGAEVLAELGDPLGTGTCRLLQGRLPGTDVVAWLLEAPSVYEVPGGPYLDPEGQDHANNLERFGLLGRVAAMLTWLGPSLGFRPDVVHAHDWQAGLLPAYLAWWGGARPGSVMTIHNLRFQGRFPPAAVKTVGLPSAAYGIEGVECYGTMSFLKAGLYYADRLTTVSPSYAAEICDIQGGEGLHGLLNTRSNRLHGLLNGIDDTVWNPRTDPALPQTFDAESLPCRAANKRALQDRLRLTVDARVPLIGMVSRLTDQKGIDLLLGALDAILKRGAQLAVVGSGDAELEKGLTRASAANPRAVAFVRGYDERLAHQIFGAVDLFAVPSRFEPCGLTQLYAMRYGAIPVARRTGGLADTVPDVREGGLGFTFDAIAPAALGKAVDRALAHYASPHGWQALQRRAMAKDHSWSFASRAYRQVYERAIADACGPRPGP